GPQFFMEIAKFRALRLLWTRVVAALHGDPSVAKLARVRAVTGHTDKSRLDPHVNLLRVTAQALSAVLGGCDALHIAAFDEAAGTTTDFSRRVARNVHTLLAEEFGMAATIDPAGGSWYVEKVTDELARKAWALFQDIERRGGFAAALREGQPQELVERAAVEKRDAVAKRRSGLVGTNVFPNLKEATLEPAAGIDVAARADELRSRRGSMPVARATPDWASLFTAALSLAREGATVGQLSRWARTRKTAEPPIAAVKPLRLAADFEALRAATAPGADGGGRPKVFLAKIGPVAQHKARADFAAGFFATGGFETVSRQSHETAEAAAVAALTSGAPIAVLCSTDETYPALVPAFARTLKTASPSTVVIVAGLPADPAVVAAYRDAGVDEFIHRRANLVKVLGGLLKRIGATK
ncbi:MAG TPA: methylmalonyl-CoA mutase family protein, partial [Opitutus sp.]|nr:methylmalonyl-CoA mutase family protein [Opitutus sp.]